MVNEMQVFDFEDKPVRTLVGADGEPWWVAADVCRVIALAGDPGQHTRRLDDDEKGLITIQTPGGDQKAAAVNESGLWALVLLSRKPEAKRFKKWITSAVLPSIRKHGAYVHPSASAGPPEDSKGLLAYAEILVSNLRRQIALEAGLKVIEAEVAENKAEVARLARVVLQEPGWAALETFASREGIDLGTRASVEGKAVKRLAAAKGIEPRKWNGSRYDVNIWPEAILREWLADYRGRPSIEKAG